MGSDLANRLNGNGGTDFMDGALGADMMDGGTGVDTASYATRILDLNVTAFDGVANDGEAGEGDNVLNSVENVVGGKGNDSLVGNASDNLLAGNGGNDTLRRPRRSRRVAGRARNGPRRLHLADRVVRGHPGRRRRTTAPTGASTGFSEEFDNVEPDIENVDGGSAPDVLIG